MRGDVLLKLSRRGDAANAFDASAELGQWFKERGTTDLADYDRKERQRQVALARDNWRLAMDRMMDLLKADKFDEAEREFASVKESIGSQSNVEPSYDEFRAKFQTELYDRKINKLIGLRQFDDAEAIYDAAARDKLVKTTRNFEYVRGSGYYEFGLALLKQGKRTEAEQAFAQSKKFSTRYADECDAALAAYDREHKRSAN